MKSDLEGKGRSVYVERVVEYQNQLRLIFCRIDVQNSAIFKVR